MNRSVALFLFLLFPFLQPSAQLSEGGLPYSLSLKQLKGTVSLPEFGLKDFDKAALLEEDRLHPTPYRYAVFEDVNIDLRLSGRKDTIPGNPGTIWRLKIKSDSAYSIQVILRKFYIPPGATLFIYNEGLSQIAGAFTLNNMQKDSTLVIADIVGKQAIIEYFEPVGAAFKGKIVIGSIAKAYKDIYQPQAGSTYININCPEGKSLQTSKHAVCKITFRSGKSSYLCTGSLINNARKDGKPYFLTASHCISDSAEASTLVAYFNYENQGCDGNALTPKTLSGAKLLSTSPASDYTLLLLHNDPVSSYQPYYAGWDANDSVTDHVAGIHHPEGLTKKLSLDNDTISSNTTAIQWQGNTSSPVSSHWQVDFDEGKTAGGSSGSPLFNKRKQIIGQLHGGDSTYDLYGKFCYSWIHTSGKYPGLKSFLDPDNTGKMTLDGYSPASNPPDAFIDFPVSKVCIHAPVKLSDFSAFPPYTSNWTITPSTYIFTAGTSQSSANPVVEFLQSGSYSVKLKITKSSGTDSMKISNAFQAGETIDVSIASLPSGEACFCNFDHFMAWASGAASYQWNLLSGSEDKVILNRNSGDTVLVHPVPGLQADSSITVGISVTGTQGTCSDTASLNYVLIKQVNDSVRDAAILQYGKSRTYSNKCATVETSEPIPPHYSCTTQYSWCDEYGTGQNIVEHSVWFKFIAAGGNYVSISSAGFDDEMALYQADTYQDILDSNFVFVAANDDRSTTDYNPLIRSAKVIPGKTYWLQVDGSGGGMDGSFYLQLSALTITGISPERESLLIIYPQPAKDIVYIKGNVLLNLPVHVSVFSPTGTLVYDNTVRSDAGTLTLDIGSWEKGVYVAKIESGNDRFVARIIKY
jgi:hypothetical protein